MNSELDKMFERGTADVSRTPRTPLSDEQIAAAAKESKSGVVLWMRMHEKEILAVAILLAVGIAGTLMIVHFTKSQGNAPEPAETVAAVACDTTMGTDDMDARSAEPATFTVETRHGTSLQNDQSVTTPAKTNTEAATSAVETRRAASLQTEQSVTTSAKPNTEPATPPVVVKKTIVRRDTVVINETVTVKDTVYLMDN
jgi:cytoskeletal protein RodZ